jgi:hypothetical protein
MREVVLYPTPLEWPTHPLLLAPSHGLIGGGCRPLADSRSLQTPTPPTAAPLDPVSTVRISFLALCHVPTIGLAPPGLEPSSHRPRLGLPLCPLLAMPGPISLLCHCRPAWAIPANSAPLGRISPPLVPPGHVSPTLPRQCAYFCSGPARAYLFWPRLGTYFPLWPRVGASLSLWPRLGV